MLKNGDIIEFDRKKQFKYIRPLGSGGTGDTHLFEDELTELHFAFKKYSPKNIDYLEECYERFVDEIKILFNISHPNIVRVYNYYLYPESKIGYLQMEYVEGCPIDEYEYDGWGKDWDEVFREVILAFEYLETNNILHRDIRPANILIDYFGDTKIIDFGFGKKLKKTERDGKSVLLNWPVTNLPEETLHDGTYNHQTEIYFVGKLFKSIFAKSNDSYIFEHVIEKMIKENPQERYESFFEVSQDISIGVLSDMDFSEEDKQIYREFAEKIYSKINYYIDAYEPINKIQKTIEELGAVLRKNKLEYYIQDNSMLINCFISGRYNFSLVKNIEVKLVEAFYRMFIALPEFKKKVVLDNIYTKIGTIQVELEDDDIPF
ncbi:protein kinase family protein [Alkaliphilus peptidifermentans]|uniref:Serine/threonine protein kinase n=1 Tax=Alkaliphilus peptidifermentans DSM 18978 TaxID=1120976 RepID=A0A1G5LCC6_9FIRM|nr:protein kinase family protein [Alkaliphilus peptidifermentans]SCZ10555.1 serine/threonine protein kinase [Alkaliphilus peptidifermentans DSM 18978]